ncbi:DUF2510 domain-containing protein [Streptomyces sp. JJ36]|uniref:DUF2510 domain-containing protein n=1 Tax=Streptomyces sp. JJ36 TaxID=2736645 RepID=UPI001F20FEDD|nr:DUF2510 domain-containing protein [Streptomyces sp. JJ36]
MRTPPGWFADPGYTGTGPALERWWDGERWTEHTRPAEAPPPPPPGSVPPQPPGSFPVAPPGYPPSPQKRSRGPAVAALAGAAAVALALVVGGVVIAGSGGGDDDGTEARQSSPPTGAPESTGPPDDGSREGPESGPSTTPDGDRMTPASGVVLPLLDGWTRSPGFHGASVNGKSYTCPGDKPERCVRAGAIVLNAASSGTPEDVARGDIRVNAESSYAADYYGGITAHEEIEAGEVRVAGQDGYRVRWRIDNRVDPDAYVESVAFEHPDGSGRMLLLRSGFDIHADAPPLGHMDRLVKGIREGRIAEDDNSEQV